MVFRLPAMEESLPYINEVSLSIMKVCGLDDMKKGKLMLALEEAAINSIKYAYDPGNEGMLELEFDSSLERLSIKIKDFGKGIDPKLLRIYDVNDMDSIVSTNGRGFFLMQAMTDEFIVDSEPGKGTTVHIAKHLEGL